MDWYYRRISHSTGPKNTNLADFGLTEDDYRDLCGASGDLCWNPRCAETHGCRRMHVDHAHYTDIVRGLLCDGCNTCLGQVDDNIDRLGQMIAYLGYWQADPRPYREITPRPKQPHSRHVYGSSDEEKRERARVAGRDWRRRNFRYELYKLTLDEFHDMVREQDGRCACCGTRPSDTLHVDHDHCCCPGRRTCGQCIRGLLCAPCNFALGCITDSIIRVEGLIEYLQRPFEDTISGWLAVPRYCPEGHDLVLGADQQASTVVSPPRWPKVCAVCIKERDRVRRNARQNGKHFVQREEERGSGTSKHVERVSANQCHEGHELTAETLYIEPKTGKRHCRLCRRIYMAAYYRQRESGRVA